ncbi:hypothetical protein BD779DRAFT_1491811 [Infundibulicybe gibba]|nr:hypothetical protein BD779DRAFT_1491811 [Infundibulicybe gibba]
MRLFFLILLLAVLATVVSACEDHEIFDLVSAVETAEGKGTTFYSWLDVPSTATTNEIAKAYRKMSMQLHPDKNPNSKGIHERFARLGVVATILRNKESRKRYDFFYKNGVPKWRGTGYYYQRFRPGLGVRRPPPPAQTLTNVPMIILSRFCLPHTLTSGLQLLVQRMNYKTDLDRVERFIREARLAAWGPKMIPIEGKRKVRVSLGGPQRIDDEGNPSSTWFISLLKNTFASVLNRTKQDEPEPDVDDDSSTTTSEATRSGTSTPKEGITRKKVLRKR